MVLCRRKLPVVFKIIIVYCNAFSFFRQFDS